MKNFRYVDAKSPEQAVKALGPKSLPLAGGTDLLNAMKDYAVQPDALVNVKNIERMRGMGATRGGFYIGANVTLAEIVESKEIGQTYPALVEALRDAGTPQIRNMATLGGNLCARPRCWYFRQEVFDCRKRGGTGCAAIEGDNELHAIFQTEGPCVMVHPSSAAPPLYAYGAKAVILGPRGERQIPIEELFVAPAKKMESETTLAPDEILLSIHLSGPGEEPAPTDWNVKSATYEVRHKQSHDWPLALASAVLWMKGNKVESARICLGAVAPIPWSVPHAAQLLSGQEVTEELATAAAAKAIDFAKPLSQNRYKLQIVRTAVKRAILAAATGKRV